jgi:protein-tyrosine-phosphatase
MPLVVTLCTGNAARSVMAGALLDGAGGIVVMTRGTHVIEGLPMSWRTADAIKGLGLTTDGHRSRQLADDDLEHADLVLAMAREHVEHVRRRHPAAAARTGTLKRLARDLPALSGPLRERLAALHLDEVELEPWEDVDDPAGGEADVFHECAGEIHALLSPLLPLLRDEVRHDEILRDDAGRGDAA